MCGICGLVRVQNTSDEIHRLTQAMTDCLGHRGPDDQGVWTDGDSVSLGHARLSILDLSALGHQPMSSPTGRWTVAYNGEAYNFADLRTELEQSGVLFRGHSDTEVIVAALEEWGFVTTLQRIRGMFALAAWNTETRDLFLARDRLGQKPLFYGFHHGFFVFGSELRILGALGARPSVDLNSAALMLRYECIPAPHTIYQNIWKLPPASVLVYSERDRSISGPKTFWKPSYPRSGDYALPTLEEIRGHLMESVKLRMVSDVPIGSFLSGGIDSSLVTSYMQKLSSKPVRSFTVSFADKRYNEASQAAKIASHLGTRHTEIPATEADAIELVPKLGEIYDEPFGDPSQLPTTLLCQLTRQHVTVALSGDGGDELFRGYNRAVWLPRLSRLLSTLPEALRGVISSILGANWLRETAEFFGSTGLLKTRLITDKLNKLASVTAAPSFQARYRALLSDWHTPRELLPGASSDFVDEFNEISNSLPLEDQLGLADFLFYLPNDVLTKVDRASMSAGLEVRSPFLDHELIAHCIRFHPKHNIRGLTGKCILRDLLKEELPPNLFSGPKMGFAAPIESWLRGELKEWAGDLLNSHWLRQECYFQEQLARESWDLLQSGTSDTSGQIWNILMLASWLEANR